MSHELATQVRRFKQGDRDAASALARRAGDAALRTATAALGDRELARDVAQDVAVIVLSSIAKLRDPGRFDAWVHRITVNEVRAAIGAQARRRAEESLDTISPAKDLDIHSGAGASVDPDSIIRRDLLRGALAELPPRQRIALALRYVHDLSEAEIADALGCRPGTAGSLLSRGRSALRRHPSLRELAVQITTGGAS